MKDEDKEIARKLGLDLRKEAVLHERGAVDMQRLRAIAKDLADNWNLPTCVIAFIANSLEENHKGRVMPWPHMKELIFRIYEQRVKWAPEVSGSVNTSYLSLEEFVILHFLKEGKLRRTAELSIIDFVTSLKYYAKLWPRAKMFACLCGMLKFGETMETELSTSSCDIFVQEYYFYLFSLFYSDRTGWVESPDGVTYVRFDKEEEFSKAALDWMATGEAKKFTNKVRKYVKKMND